MVAAKWRKSLFSGKLAALGVVFLLGCAGILQGQGLGSEALSSFPSDTQQIAYVNLAQLRTLPNYQQLRSVLFSRQMQNFEEFLQPLGTDPEKDVDEVVLGWRGSATGGAPSFGLAAGRFHPESAQEFVTKEQLPSRQYAGYELDSFGSGLGPGDLFFTFFSSDLAAFGGLSDLKALIDAYQGSRATLNSNSEFANWEAELEGSGPQWGITTGKAAAGIVAPLLLNGSKQKTDLSSLFGPIKAVLYQVDWDSDFSAQISAICQDSQTAGTLARLLTLWQNSIALMGSRPAGVTAFIQGLRIDAEGQRVELAGSGPPDVLSRVFQSSTGP